MRLRISKNPSREMTKAAEMGTLGRGNRSAWNGDENDKPSKKGLQGPGGI